MRKPKATVKSLRAEMKLLQAHFDTFKENARAYVLAVGNNGGRRALMTITPANENGMVNGITIPELVMLVNLNNSFGENVLLETTNNNKNLLIVAKKKNPAIPWLLL